MELIFENFRQYLDADEDTLTGLSFEEMSRALGSSMGGAKLALTDSPLQDRTYEQGSTMKPNGLWYAKGNSWMEFMSCLLYTSPSPRDATLSRMPSSA